LAGAALIPSRVAKGGSAAADPRSWPLIGRSEEVAFCRTLFAQREWSGIVVTGAAGVGKTRLAAEVVRVAEDAGYATVRVTATEAGRVIPLGPFAHLLPPEADTARTLLQLLRISREAIATREDGRRVALLVDDAHLLDAASAMLVQQLAAAHEAVVVATVRTGEPLPDAVVALWKDHGVEYLELQPLALEETGLLVESVVGGEVDGETKHRLWSAGRGLPLIVRELVLHGLERGGLVAVAGLWRWRGPLQSGGRLLELIGTRIGQLDGEQQALLELVALGEPLAWSLLETSEADAADDLIRRGLLAAERDGRRLELRLAHPLFGESVRASMPATRGSTHQRRLADVLEGTGLRRSGDLLRYAVWRSESGGTASPELLLAAAAVAFSRADPVLSERLARAAAEVGGGFSTELAVARALIPQGRFAEAEAILVPLTPAARTDEERASVAAERGLSLLMGQGRRDEAEAVLVGAQRSIFDEGLRRELELCRCSVLAAGGRWAEQASVSLALFEDAGGDRALRLDAGVVAASALVPLGRVEDALTVVARCEPFAEKGFDRTRLRMPTAYLRMNYLQAKTLALLYAGRLAEADVAAHEAYDVFVGGRTTDATAVMAIGSGLVALVQGAIERAARWFREAAGLLSEPDSVLSGAVLSGALACTARALGQAGDTVGAKSAAAEAEKAQLAGCSRNDESLLLGRAWAAAAEGAITEARQSAIAAVNLSEERGALSAAFMAAHEVVRLGDPATGATRLTELVGDVQGSLVGACAEHAQAILARDPRRIERAASSFTELGALLWAAEAERAAASAHREAGREASARAAAARAALLLEHCGGARTPALAAAGPVEELTPREREIAALAASGASNREIAARLVVSVRTVENHLQRAYRKLGVDSRRELPGLLAVHQ
jgi:DNA-binding CsgD family transcriptional regulator